MWTAETNAWQAPTTGVNECEWTENGEWKNSDGTDPEEAPTEADDEEWRDLSWEPQSDSPFEHRNWSKIYEPFPLERET